MNSTLKQWRRFCAHHIFDEAVHVDWKGWDETKFSDFLNAVEPSLAHKTENTLILTSAEDARVMFTRAAGEYFQSTEPVRVMDWTRATEGGKIVWKGSLWGAFRESSPKYVTAKLKGAPGVPVHLESCSSEVHVPVLPLFGPEVAHDFNSGNKEWESMERLMSLRSHPKEAPVRAAEQIQAWGESELLDLPPAELSPAKFKFSFDFPTGNIKLK